MPLGLATQDACPRMRTGLKSAKQSTTPYLLPELIFLECVSVFLDFAPRAFYVLLFCRANGENFSTDLLYVVGILPLNASIVLRENALYNTSVSFP
jgi:hypothetical protein